MRRAVEEVEVLRGSLVGTTPSDAGFLEPWVDNSRDCNEDSAAGAECSGAHRPADKAGVGLAVHWDACIRLWRDDLTKKNCCSSTP